MSRIISFPQAFALNKGANYFFNATFTGLPITTLTRAVGYTFTQPAFTSPAPNLYNSTGSLYTITNSTNTASAGLIFKFGGNLVDTAIKWTNGKSLGNWYKILKHGSSFTGGSVEIEDNKIAITCGNTTNILNRAIIHDTKFNRSGAEITEQSATVVGYLQPQDTALATIYYKGFVKPFDFNAVDPTSGLRMGHHTIFWVGFRYLHSQTMDGANTGLNVYTGTSKGFGFIGVRKNNTQMTWHCVVIADVEAVSGDAGFCFIQDTNLSIFTPNTLQITFNNGTLTWFANGSQVATTSISTLVSLGNFFQGGTTNPMYAGIASMKGGANITPPGQFTIYVQEAGVFRSLAHINLGPYNRFEDTDTEVTATDTDYHITGLHLLKKLK